MSDMSYTHKYREQVCARCAKWARYLYITVIWSRPTLEAGHLSNPQTTRLYCKECSTRNFMEKPQSSDFYIAGKIDTKAGKRNPEDIKRVLASD